MNDLLIMNRFKFKSIKLFFQVVVVLVPIVLSLKAVFLVSDNDNR